MTVNSSPLNHAYGKGHGNRNPQSFITITMHEINTRQMESTTPHTCVFDCAKNGEYEYASGELPVFICLVLLAT